MSRSTLILLVLCLLTNYASTLTILPPGLSIYSRKETKTLDLQTTFRGLAKAAIERATKDNVRIQELEFPPLLGGRLSKTQFDDFDNVSELNANADFCMQLIADISKEPRSKAWLLFPDLKECEIAGTAWLGQIYQSFTRTTIASALVHLDKSKYISPWGSTAINMLNNALGDVKLLGDTASQTPLNDDNSPPNLIVSVQPGNGGPVEDWINVEAITNSASDATVVIVNGALDKLRNGYYPKVFFPKLMKTVDRFYRKEIESVFYLKPISEKGKSAYVFRVYPEPWQIVVDSFNSDTNEVEYVVKGVVDKQPTFSEVVTIMNE